MRYIPEELAIILQIVCMIGLAVALALDIGHEIIQYDWDNKQWRIKKEEKRSNNRVVLYVFSAGVVLKLCEVVAHVVVMVGYAPSSESYRSFFGSRWSTVSPMEVLFVFLIEQSYHRLCGVTLRTIPQFAALVAVVGVGIFIFAVLGMTISLHATKSLMLQYFNLNVTGVSIVFIRVCRNAVV
jgi:hypothetical protein